MGGTVEVAAVAVGRDGLAERAHHAAAAATAHRGHVGTGLQGGVVAHVVTAAQGVRDPLQATALLIRVQLHSCTAVVMHLEYNQQSQGQLSSLNVITSFMTLQPV